MSRLRNSLAAKLLAAGITLSLVIVGGVGGYLLFSREQQTRTAALSNADNRAAVMLQVLERFTGFQSLTAAEGLANQPPLADALASPDPQRAVAALFAGAVPVDLSGEVLVITDATGRITYSRTAPDLTAPGLRPISAAPLTTPVSVTTALAGATTRRCSIAGLAAPGACGVERLDGRTPAYDVAVPVLTGTVVRGAVAYLAPLGVQLARFKALFQYPTAYIPAPGADEELRLSESGESQGVTPAVILSGVRAASDVVHGIYPAPVGTRGVEDVAGSFVPVNAPDGSLAGYIGVEAPLSLFLAGTRTDEITLGVITVFVLLLTVLAVTLFVDRFVRRPINRLERGVARIAQGDYATAIELRSNDELGHLARDVNSMRASIATYVGEIEQARARLDRALSRASGVSRALTRTTAGIPALHREVVRTAADIAGGGSVALLALRDDGAPLVPRAVHPESAGAVDLSGWDLVAVLGGSPVRTTRSGHGCALAVPMFYRQEVVGALVVITPPGAAEVTEDALGVLTILANNAAVATENARLFEQERDLVRRLRELDAMKTDFLATVQHELRTPLTAILGLSDLIEMCWDMWDETPKLDAIRDIQMAAKNLYDIVETIIDFAMLEDEALVVERSPVAVRSALESALAAISERTRGGLPVPVAIEGDESIAVHADPPRFQQAIRALLDNAVKFSDGRGTVRVAVEKESPGVVRIAVADEGIGIPPEEMPRIFERFYQVDNTTTRRYGGTGMGLALVKKVVEAHGASIRVESSASAGSRFILRWPAPPE